MSRLSNALFDLNQMSQPRRTVVPATLGNGDGTTVKISDRPGYHWVRLYGDINQAVPALNRVTAAVYNLQVEVAVSTDRSQGKATYEVLGIGSNEILTYSTSGTPVAFDPYMPEHGRTHSWSSSARGRDPVNIYPRNFAMGRVYQTSPASMRCVVSPIEYQHGNAIQIYSGGQTIDFTGEIPSSGGTAKLAYIYINGDSESLDYKYSEEFNWTGFTDPVPSSARISIPDGYLLLSSPILYYGMTTITEANFRYEMRPIFKTVDDPISPDSASGDTVISLSGATVITTDHSVVIAGMARGVSAWSVSGTTKSVGSSGDFATIQEAVNWFSGKLVGSNCRISVEPGTYNETVSINNIITAGDSLLEIVGDTRSVVGQSWVEHVDRTGYDWPNLGFLFIGNDFFVYTNQADTSVGGPWAFPFGLRGVTASDTVYIKDANHIVQTLDIESVSYAYGACLTLSDSVDMVDVGCHFGIMPNTSVTGFKISENVRGVKIRGFAVTDSSSNSAGAITIEEGAVAHINNCMVYGIVCKSKSVLHLSTTTVKSHVSTDSKNYSYAGRYTGITATNGAYVHIEDKFCSVLGWNRVGIFLECDAQLFSPSGWLKVADNKVGIYLGIGSKVDTPNCLLYGNGTGVKAEYLSVARGNRARTAANSTDKDADSTSIILEFDNTVD